MSFERCEEHPDRLLEWDGYMFVCPACVLSGWKENEGEDREE